MAFLLQDDSGSVSGANAYVDVAAFRAYHLDRGLSTTQFMDAAVQAAVVKATEYLDGRWVFVGMKTQPAQRTMWPRINALDDDDFLRVGIPPEVKDACCEYALIALTQDLNPTPTRDASGRAVQSQTDTVGPISSSVTFVGGGPFERPRYPKADQRLRRLTEAGGTLSRG